MTERSRLPGDEREAAGVSNWDKLSAEQRVALLSANYNGSKLIGPGMTGVLKNQDDPAWRDKAWWEMAVNVQDQTPRRVEEANAFTTNSFLKSPVENLYADRAYTRNLLNAAGREVRANMLNASEDERRRAGY